MDRSERKALLIALQNSPVWSEIISVWLDEWDDEITNAIKKNIMNLKSDETTKWMWYYSGQASALARLRAYIKVETSDSPIDRMKDVVADWMK